MSSRDELRALAGIERWSWGSQGVFEAALNAYRAEVLRETAEDLRVLLARTTAGQSGDLDIVLGRLVDMADAAEQGETDPEGFRTFGLPLSTSCSACGHTLNWHSTSGTRTACQAGRCDCAAFSATQGETGGAQ